MKHAKRPFLSLKKLLIHALFLLGFFIFTGEALAQIACPGLASTVPSPNGQYKVTAFGCVNGWTDPNDNCIPARQPAICGSRSGPDCERWLNWYAANVDVFGVNKKVLVTRPDTGKSVVVMTIDIGPNCTRERIYGPLLDLSYSAATYLGPAGGNYETVSARLVPDDTPLGPTDGSGIPIVENGESTTGNGAVSGSFTIRLRAKIRNDANGEPLVIDDYVVNRAEATAVGGGTASAESPGGATGLPGQPLPSSNTIQIKQVLCQQYKVCPTESRNAPPSQAWTLPELTALWNVVQRIYASPAYKNLTIAGPGIEIQRINHCPGCAGWVQGLQAGTGTGGSTVPGSNLIYITNNAGPDRGLSTTYLEWLYAHEIAHVAGFGLSGSGYPSSFASCGQVVSSYGRGSTSENFADAVSFYMTNGEQAQNYLGGSGNLKADFSCAYNALKDNVFGGVEF